LKSPVPSAGRNWVGSDVPAAERGAGWVPMAQLLPIVGKAG
jgi:hypothetical protein